MNEKKIGSEDFLNDKRKRFPSKVLRNITNTQWFVPNMRIQRDLKMNSVKSEIVFYFLF